MDLNPVALRARVPKLDAELVSEAYPPDCTTTPSPPKITNTETNCVYPSLRMLYPIPPPTDIIVKALATIDLPCLGNVARSLPLASV